MDSVNLENGYTAKFEHHGPHYVGTVYNGKRLAGDVVVTKLQSDINTNVLVNKIHCFDSLESLQMRIDDLGAIKELYKIMEGVKNG
jgi:hypothetical protein